MASSLFSFPPRGSAKLSSFRSDPTQGYKPSQGSLKIHRTDNNLLKVNEKGARVGDIPLWWGLVVDGGCVHQQTVAIRRYEASQDKTATVETILNVLQETAQNHLLMLGLGPGTCATHAMVKNNLTWVLKRMHVQLDAFPLWGEEVEIESWFVAIGQNRNRVRRDWLLRSPVSGNVFARATSTLVMINHKTRNLFKITEEVRDELSPFFLQKQAINEAFPAKIMTLDDTMECVGFNLKPKRSELDENRHVNNVHYASWMLECFPEDFLENHQLSSITIEYMRECNLSNEIRNICTPDQDRIRNSTYKCPRRYVHILQIEGDEREECARGLTTWKEKAF